MSLHAAALRFGRWAYHQASYSGKQLALYTRLLALVFATAAPTASTGFNTHPLRYDREGGAEKLMDGKRTEEARQKRNGRPHVFTDFF